MLSIPRKEWGNQAQWAVTAVLLFAHLAGAPGALAAALALCAASTAYYAVRLGGPWSFRVQVRLGFMLVAGLGCWPALAPIVWIPALGTSAQVLVGYCPMARLLELMPWNRSEPAGLRDVVAVVTRAPGAEGLLRLRRAPIVAG